VYISRIHNDYYRRWRHYEQRFTITGRLFHFREPDTTARLKKKYRVDKRRMVMVKGMLATLRIWKRLEASQFLYIKRSYASADYMKEKVTARL
jgi:hypothetical protein